MIICGFSNWWGNARMLRLAFYKHPKADLCAHWRRFWTIHVRSMVLPLKGGLNSIDFFLDSSKKWLQSLESRIPDGGDPSRSEPAPIMPSPAATTGGSSAPAPSLQTAHRTWSSGCPPLLRELTTVRTRKKDGVPLTDLAYYYLEVLLWRIYPCAAHIRISNAESIVSWTVMWKTRSFL